MFDEDNPTNTEEILQQGISEVLLKRLNPLGMADMIRLASESGTPEAEKSAELYVNGKG